MASKPVATTQVGVELVGGMNLVQELKAALEKLKIQPDVKGTHDTIQKAGKIFENSVRDAIKKAGVDSKKNLNALNKSFRDNVLQTIALQQKLTKAGLQTEERDRYKSQLKTQFRERKALKARLAEESKALDSATKSRMKSLGKFVNDMGDGSDKFAKGLARSFGDIMGGRVGSAASRGLGGTSKLLKGGGGKLGKMGFRGAAGLGKVVAGMGAVVGVLGGLAAAIALVTKLILDMDKQIKDMNKDLVKSAGAYEFLGKRGSGSLRELDDNLKLVREASANVEHNMKWMTTQKEQLAIFKALQAADYGFQKITAGATTAAEKTEKLFDATSMVLQVSRQLGMDSAKVAEKQAQYMQQTGENAEETRDSFSKLLKVASLSGFNMKRFYSTILESTSGLYYYNQRLGEAAELLKKMTDMLGQKAGTEFFKSVQQGFAEMGYKERFKQILTAGRGGRDVFRTAAVNAANSFGETLSKNEAFRQAIERAGGFTVGEGAAGAKGLAGRLAKMNEPEFAKFIAKMQLESTGPEDARKIQEMVTLRAKQRGATGGIGERAKAIGMLGGSESLAMKMQNFLGPLHELSAIQLAAFEDFKGISGSQLETLRRLSRQFHGQYEILKENAKLQKKGVDISAKNQETAEKFGFAVNKQNKIVSARMSEGKLVLGDNEITSVASLMATQSSSIDEFVGAAKTDAQVQQDLAKQVVKNTEPLSKILDITITGLLSDIREAVAPLGRYILKIIAAMPGTGAAGDYARSSLAADDLGSALQKRAQDAVDNAKSQLEAVQAAREKEMEGKTDLQKAGIRAKYGSTEDALFEKLAFAERAKSTVATDFSQSKIIQKAMEDAKASGKDVDEAIEEAIKKANKDQIEKYMSSDAFNADKQIAADSKVGTEIKNALVGASGKSLYDGFEELQKEMKRQAETRSIQDELRRLNVEGDQHQMALDFIGASDYQRAQMKRRWHMESQKQKSLLDTSDLTEDQINQLNNYAKTLTTSPTENAQDFIVTSSGRVIKPSAQDAIMGMKPGGPIANAMAGGGTRGGGVTVNVYESHDTNKTYEAVKRALNAGGVI